MLLIIKEIIRTTNETSKADNIHDSTLEKDMCIKLTTKQQITIVKESTNKHLMKCINANFTILL